MKKSVKQTKTKIGREAGQDKSSQQLARKKPAAKKTTARKPAVKKVVLGYRASNESPGIVGRRERTVDGVENWPRLGRKLSRENQLLSSLAGQVRQFREAKGLSIMQLAKFLNAAPATLIKFEEKNGTIPVKLLLQICDKLGVTLQVTPQD